jgi:hypothetical protein
MHRDYLPETEPRVRFRPSNSHVTLSLLRRAVSRNWIWRQQTSAGKRCAVRREEADASKSGRAARGGGNGAEKCCSLISL